MPGQHINDGTVKLVRTPLSEFESEFLVEPAQDENDDEIEQRGSHAGYGRRMRLEQAGRAAVQRYRYQDTIEDRRYDEYQHHEHLQTDRQTDKRESSSPSITHSLFPSRLKTRLFHKSFPPWSALTHLDCLLGLYWTGLTLLNGFHF